MENTLMEIMKDAVDKKLDENTKETKAVDISNLMTNLKLTLEQAMDALNISQDERAIYAGLIQKKM